MSEENLAQLACNVCKSKKLLTEEEIVESRNYLINKQLPLHEIPDLWSYIDGKKCPNGVRHEYRWDEDFREKMLDDSDIIRENELTVMRNINENKDLEIKKNKFTEDTNHELEKLIKEMENQIEQKKNLIETKINETKEKIDKNNEYNTSIEILNDELKESVFKTSGREWKEWL